MYEILAPCGSFEMLISSLRSGCTAVYLGSEKFSARGTAANFTPRQLEEAVFECHKRGVKIYQAINTIIFDQELEECAVQLKRAAELGIDGIIIQDPGVYRLVKECCGDMPIHASTQMGIHSPAGVKFVKNMGFERVVLARELSLEKLKELSELGIQTEAFVHGALCMSVSGQCYMSAVIGSRSANRGFCAQACRLPIKGGGKEYALSLKDMSYIGKAKNLVEAGVYSLKIEGRMKRPEYAAAAVDSLKKSLEGEDYDQNILRDVFSREGFTQGYLNNKMGEGMFGVRTKEDVQASAEVFSSIHHIYRYEEKRDKVKFFLKISRDEVSLKICDSLNNTAKVYGETPQPAKNKEINDECAVKQLSKLGDTIYQFDSAQCDIQKGFYVSQGELNRLRREAVLKLDHKRAKAFSKKVEFFEGGYEKVNRCESIGGFRGKLRISVNNLSQLVEVDFSKVEFCIIPLELCKDIKGRLPREKIMVKMPRFTFNEDVQRRLLERAAKEGIEHILCTNFAHIELAKEFSMQMHGGFGLNISNSKALKVLRDVGFSDTELSPEIKFSQAKRLERNIPVGIYAYGRLPLMLTVNCPLFNGGCKNCTGKLVDRSKREFLVSCPKKAGLKYGDYTEVLNSQKIFLADKLKDLGFASFLVLDFFEENSAQVRKIIGEYEAFSGEMPKEYTRGLYYRGVK